MQIPFTFFLSETMQGDEFEEYISDLTGLPVEQIRRMGIGEPFYEIGISCVLDTDQGQIIIMGLDKDCL